MKHHLLDAMRHATRATEATINLMDGESLDDFRSKLCDAAHLEAMGILSNAALAAGYDPSMEDMGVEDPDFRGYVQSVGTDFLVMRVHRSHPWMSLYLRMKWLRAADGTFSFGAPELVTERTVYDPDPNAEASFGAFVGAGLPAVEAVEKPTMAQRKNLPAAAYAAPYFAGEDGAYKAGGKFMASKSALPFHINTAKASESAATIDVPRLRNALARFDQTDWSRFGDAADAVKARAAELLDGAKSVLADAKAAAAAGEAVLAKLPGAPTRADVDGLVAAFEAFDRASIPGRAVVAFESLGSLARRAVEKNAMGATESAEVQRQADEVLAVAKKLGVDAPEVAKLKRRAGALQLARLHDVAQGLV